MVKFIIFAFVRVSLTFGLFVYLSLPVHAKKGGPADYLCKSKTVFTGRIIDAHIEKCEQDVSECQNFGGINLKVYVYSVIGHSEVKLAPGEIISTTAWVQIDRGNDDSAGLLAAWGSFVVFRAEGSLTDDDIQPILVGNQDVFGVYEVRDGGRFASRVWPIGRKSWATDIWDNHACQRPSTGWPDDPLPPH